MIVNVEILKEHLRVDFEDDDEVIERKIAAAQDHIERHLGYRIAEEYPDGAPAALIEATCQLVGHWYEHREAVVTGTITSEMPLNVADIVREYRNWSW